jgi:hypothetical protein
MRISVRCTGTRRSAESSVVTPGILSENGYDDVVEPPGMEGVLDDAGANVGLLMIEYSDRRR